jgi:hypothetical protein
MLHRYIPLSEFHRRRGEQLDPPDWRPPRFSRQRRAADDPDPGFTGWIQKVADYLTRLDAETQRQLQRLNHPIKLLLQLPAAAQRFWFRHDKLARLVDARGQATDQLDGIVNTLATNLAISNEYLQAVLEHANRAQSESAREALEQILDITHADEAVA